MDPPFVIACAATVGRVSHSTAVLCLAADLAKMGVRVRVEDRSEVGWDQLRPGAGLDQMHPGLKVPDELTVARPQDQIVTERPRKIERVAEMAFGAYDEVVLVDLPLAGAYRDDVEAARLVIRESRRRASVLLMMHSSLSLVKCTADPEEAETLEDGDLDAASAPIVGVHADGWSWGGNRRRHVRKHLREVKLGRRTEVTWAQIAAAQGMRPCPELTGPCR